MSRLTDLISQVKANNPELGKELEREFKTLSSRLSFGLNFERHRPESVELPNRSVRKGDKVRILPARGSTAKGDQRLWKVHTFEQVDGKRAAVIELIDTAVPEIQTVLIEDLVVVAEFRDYIYPGLVSTGKVERGGGKPFHTVINGENFHALEALTFTHRAKIDVIYIDPPYNTGARDWKYNNDYVENEDIYRHSKWLAFIERRLLVAKQLLKPSSVLIVTIDEKEYLRLGLLLEQTFPEATIQMVASVINAKGVVRSNQFTRINEFIFFVMIGEQRISPEITGDSNAKVRWASLRRFEISSRRHGSTPRLGQFYPIYVDLETGKIAKIGEPLDLDESRHDVSDLPNCVTLFPVNPDGVEMIWGVTGPTLEKRLTEGFVRAVRAKDDPNLFTLYYLTSGQVADIKNGKLLVTGREPDGSAKISFDEGKAVLPKTVWDRESHNAQSHGSNLLKSILPDRRFPFPKSLYAVEDCIRLFTADRPSATILDFFSGSGTTAHAVMRLNRQDNGHRQCISITNNEVEYAEQIALRKAGLRPGDSDWEKWGICDYITKPRIAAAIRGKTLEGNDIASNYKFTDEFPMAEGFEENAEFFTLTYETPIAVSHNRAFARIAPLLWMRAGSIGRRIAELHEQGWDVADTYGLLTDLDQAAPFSDAVEAKRTIHIAFIVTDDDRRFQSVARRLPNTIEPVRLYESYLTNFRFSLGQ